MARSLYCCGGKRLWDLLGAAASLLLAAVPLAACMVLIRMETPGAALIGQWRVGRGGRPFRLWKLRTMRADAERGTGPCFAAERDPRVTRIGGWLRAWHGDELPQLWNVLRGEMRLVGPRPERPDFAARFQRVIPGYERRHTVRPGITGWAQVHCGYAATLDATRLKTRYDLAYLELAGWSCDWRICCRTWVVASAALRRRRHIERRTRGRAPEANAHSRPCRSISGTPPTSRGIAGG